MVGHYRNDELLAQACFQQLYRTFSEHVDFAGVYRIDKTFFSQPRALNRKVPTDNASLLVPNTLAIRNGILDRTSWLNSALNELKLLLVQLDSLNAMIKTSTR